MKDIAKIITEPSISSLSEYQLRVRLDLLNSYWDKVVANNVVLSRNIDRLKKHNYFKENQYTLTTELYIDTKAWFQ